MIRQLTRMAIGWRAVSHRRAGAEGLGTSHRSGITRKKRQLAAVALVSVNS